MDNDGISNSDFSYVEQLVECNNGGLVLYNKDA